MGIYKIKGSPYYLYDFTVQGTRYRGSTQAAKKGEAQAIYAKRRSEALLGNFYDAEKQLTLDQAFLKYEKEHGQFLKSYGNSIQYHIDKLLDYFGREKGFHLIGQAELEKFIADSRAKSYKPHFSDKEKKLSPSTINRRIALFRRVHKIASFSWKIQTQPINFSELRLEEPEAPNDTLSFSDAERLLDHAADHLRDFIYISLFTGFRMSNVLTLTGQQIDMDKRLISVKGKSKKPGGKIITKPIVDDLYRYIRLHRIDERDNVITYHGKPVRSVATAWETAFRDSGVRRVRRHDLRHTFGTWIYEKTGDIKFVQESLDHSSIVTTMRYAHSKKEAQQKRMNKALPKLRQSKLARVK